MKALMCVLLAGTLLAGCPSADKKAVESVESQEWQPSTLSEETLAKVQARLLDYQHCINDETRTHINDAMDSRRITDQILKNCEDKLSAVKTAFDAENVPSSISERYCRSKRSHAAQQILRVVMATQAVRSAEEAP